MSFKLILLFFLPLAFLAHAGKKDNVVLNKTFQVAVTAQTDGQRLHIAAEPQLLSQLPVPVKGPFLSRDLQTALTLHASKRESQPLVVPFAVSVRALSGVILDFRTFTVIVPGYPVGQPVELVPFEEQLSQMVGPMKEIEFVLPQDEAFLIDIAYNPPRKKGRSNTFSPEFPIRLGVAYCRRLGESIVCQSNLQTRLFEQARAHLVGALADSGDHEELITSLRRYLELVPSDRAMAALTADHYQRQDPEEGYRFVGENQPFFAQWFKRDPYNGGPRLGGVGKLKETQIEVVRNPDNDPNGVAYQTRKRMRRNPAKLPISESAWLRIVSPTAEDMVSGTTSIDFVLRQNLANNRLLSAFCLVDGVVKAELNGPPNRFTYDFKEKGRHKLQVIACFADETRVEHQIEIDVLPTNESQRVNLSEVQLIALNDKGWPSELDAKSLTIQKGNLALPVTRVWRDSNPLDLVILVDTSGSMVWRIFQAQSVIQQFLSKLGPTEAASVYAFDEKVALVKRFENDLDEMAPRLFTLLPQGATALHDALTVAHNKLSQRQGSTKAIIVLGDGIDTASKARADEVLSQFEGTPIRVFSIQLSGKVQDPFLKDLTKTTNGRYWHLQEQDDPQRALDWTLAALRQLHFVSYSNPNQHTDDVHFKLPGMRLDTLHVRNY